MKSRNDFSSFIKAFIIIKKKVSFHKTEDLHITTCTQMRLYVALLCSHSHSSGSTRSEVANTRASLTQTL